MFDRKAHWQSIYQDKNATDVSWYQKEPILSLELIQHSQIATDEAIIDVGGGASVLVDYLLKTGYTNLSVLDISAQALLCAQNRLGQLAKSVEWLETDITTFKPQHTFSLWHDRAVFHFLTQSSDRESYVNILKQSLKSHGHLIIAAFAIGGPEKCSGLDIVQYDSEKLMHALGNDFELIEQNNEVHITPANKEQKFNYFRFKKIN